MTFVERSIKIVRSGLTLVEKLPRLSTRLRQKVGKIFSKTQCPTLTVQIHGKSFKVLTVLLMLTLQTKQCPTTIAPSLILTPKLTSS